MRIQRSAAQRFVFMAVVATLPGVGSTLAWARQEQAPAAATPPAPAASPAAATTAAQPVSLPDSPAGRMMQRVLAGMADAETPLPEEVFHADFLKQVPYEQFTALTGQLRAAQGSFTPVRILKQDGDRGLTLLARASKTQEAWEIMLGLDEAEKIRMLFLRPAMDEADTPPLRDWNDFDQRMRDLPGDASFAAYEVRLVKSAAAAEAGKPEVSAKLAQVHVLNEEEQLAIGSTFKLYVLGALGEAITRGTARWDEQLAIKDIYKSLPSGVMQEEPVGAEFPISHYAEKMISISDNTATDHLIARVGREAIETYMEPIHARPALNQPFLTTREMFALKLKPDPTLIQRWLAVDEATRRDMLLPDNPLRPTRPAGATHNPGEIAAWALDIGPATGWKKPRAIDKIEWFASGKDLCRLMAELARLEQADGMEPLGKALRLNPGLRLNTRTWTKIAYKGGSEPGVLNLTWLLNREDGKMFAVSIGWNDTENPLDERRLLGLAKRAIERLEK